ncbi:hypothetical protein [Streptomyces sp. NPDC085529]|uniref:hypothetical protein n=1 Tax=Streptomyces sp. NPDC085529 TaxID=3365729 RepID=UPI0037D208D8
MTWGDHEPVFVHRGRWVYNTRSHVARMLMLATAVGVIGFYVYVSDNGQWSETELRDAVHQAARDLEAQPQKVQFGYESLVRDAIQATDQGPGGDLVIEPIDDGAGSGAVSSPAADSFEIGAAYVPDTYCMRLSPPEPPRSWGKSDALRLTVQVSRGRC